jgi:membrane-associated protease RseP (regulator of RpoE activity)
MSLLDGLLIFLLLIIAYGVIVYVLYKKGILKKYNISLYGPALMWRTQHGITFLEHRARRSRLWRWIGNLSIIYCFIAMVLMTALIIWTAWLIFGFTPAQRQALPGPEVALVIPGINPILPIEFIGYILVGIIIAIVVHEFSHGILTLVSKLKVKSLGLLYLIVPIGAFCEPDEEELKKASIAPRMRIYSVGPAANFAVTVLALLVFSVLLMSSVQPAHSGAVVFAVDSDSPVSEIGLQPGSIITSLNGTQVTNATEYFHAWNKTHANQTITLTYVVENHAYSKSITLGDKYAEYAKRNKTYVNNASYVGKGYSGIQSVLRDSFLSEYLAILKNPLTNFPSGMLTFYSLPIIGYFVGYNPLVTPFTNSFVITGPLGVLPPVVFWVLANGIYWIFWLNLAFTLFNVLPMTPLDGGFLFTDGIRAAVTKLRRGITEEKREAIARNISLAVSLIILFLLIIPFFVKYI